MSLISVVLIAAALATDAFSVAVSKGLCCEKSAFANAMKTGVVFGLFQGLMPFIGWLTGSRVTTYISAYSGYAGFIILCFIGVKMIYEAFHPSEDGCPHASGTSLKTLLVLGIATSIDALAVGLTFALQINRLPVILLYVSLIAAITCLLSLIGFFFGSRLQGVIGNKAEIVGGGVLCMIGIKMLVEALRG